MDRERAVVAVFSGTSDVEGGRGERSSETSYTVNLVGGILLSARR